ncbi:hypothetical protein BDR05DRAFT_1002619 [Suillus weaverae]|nr:hypothetical protein BDR05DRAFT_1002619 [Suillus weaverae]
MSSPITTTEHSSSWETSPEMTHAPLWMSLYVNCVTPPAVTSETLSSVPSANNPRPLRVLGDNAEYWVNDAGEPFTFKFPATLDLEGQFDRSGEYFNLPHTGLDLGALKKMRAQFEVRPLDVQSGEIFPPEAITCSLCTMDMLNVVHGEAEDARNALIRSTDAYPRDAPFWWSFSFEGKDRLSLVVTSELLVQGTPDPAQASVPRLRRCDIGKGQNVQTRIKSDHCHALIVSMNSLGATAKSNAEGSNGGPPASETPPVKPLPGGTQRLSDLPDPLGHYSALILQYNLQECTVVAPNIHDGHGMLSCWSVSSSCEWTISLSRRPNCPPEDRNSSRRYQVMLKLMKLLPDTKVTEETFIGYFSDVKGKRKATCTPEDAQSSKKFEGDRAADKEDGSKSQDDDENDSLYGEQAMLITDD